MIPYSHYVESASYIRSKIGAFAPKVLMVLGSGGVTKLCAEGGRKIFRLANHKYPKEYIENIEEILRKKRELYENP